MTSAPLRFAPAVRCHRDLERGELKRVTAGPRLVGAFVGCPACGIVTQAGGAAFIEAGPMVEQPAGPGVGARVKRPTAIQTVEPIPCRGCDAGITVRDEFVEAAP